MPIAFVESMARLYSEYERYAPIYKKEQNKELSMVGFLMLAFVS